MTDLDRFLELFRSVGIELPAQKTADGSELYLELEQGENPLIDGYCGFVTHIAFTPEGKFLRIGAWE